MDQLNLTQFEKIATLCFTSNNPQEQKTAMKALMAHSSSQNLLTDCKQIISQSLNPYALYYALKMIRKLVSNQITVMRAEERAQISFSLKL